MSYLGILDVLTNTFAIGYLTQKYTEGQLIWTFTTMSCFSFIAIGLCGNLMLLVLLLVPFTLASSVTTACLASALTKFVKKSDVGVTLGIADSLESLCRVFAPLISGALMTWVGFNSPPLLSASVTAVLSVFTWFWFVDKPDAKDYDIRSLGEKEL